MAIYNRNNRRNAKFVSILHSRLGISNVNEEFPKDNIFDDYQLNYKTARLAEKCVERIFIQAERLDIRENWRMKGTICSDISSHSLLIVCKACQ